MLKSIGKFQEKNRGKGSFRMLLQIDFLTKNLEYLLERKKEYLLIEDEFLIKKLKKIDLESPYSHLLVKNIVQNLITSDKKLNKEDIENMYKVEERKLKEFYKFLCPAFKFSSFDILMEFLLFLVEIIIIILIKLRHLTNFNLSHGLFSNEKFAK